GTTLSPWASSRRSWRARTEPSTTGSTISRCEGLKASATCTLPAGGRRSAELELILQPQPLIGVRDVGKFGADMAAIDRFEARDNFAQRRAFGNPFVA